MIDFHVTMPVIRCISLLKGMYMTKSSATKVWIARASRLGILSTFLLMKGMM